tara:strand:- start:809 stop:2323 length:1515 start_codon:yes stop_codon:yes gene_type:complete
MKKFLAAIIVIYISLDLAVAGESLKAYIADDVVKIPFLMVGESQYRLDLQIVPNTNPVELKLITFENITDLALTFDGGSIFIDNKLIIPTLSIGADSYRIELLLTSADPSVTFRLYGVDKCEDSDGDCVSDASDFYPFNPFKSTDDWGQKVDGYPEVFTSADISDLNREGLVENINLAANYFGRYEWEWWAVGPDIDAMLGLADAWCDRRIKRGQLHYFEFVRTNLDLLKSICLTETAHPHASLKWENDAPFCCLTSDYSTYQGWMEGYRELSLNTPSSSANAGMVRILGYTATQASWPFQFDPATRRGDGYNITEYENAVLVFHEYYHVVQAQHVFSRREIVDETNNTVRPEYGPTAFSEGSANYISEYLIRKLSQDGSYNGRTINLTLRELMTQKMNEIRYMLSSCLNLEIEKLNYGNACDPYTFGMWASAYLTNKVGNINVFHEVLWQKINPLTYVGAFADTFGVNYEQFNIEFRAFLALPIEEQLLIVPDINFAANSFSP